jgi:hypothetical protein
MVQRVPIDEISFIPRSRARGETGTTPVIEHIESKGEPEATKSDAPKANSDHPLTVAEAAETLRASQTGLYSQPILTAKEVAAELRCSKAQVYRLINGDVAGVRPLPALALGRKKVVRRCSFEAWKRATENHGIVSDESESNAVDALK